MKGYMIYGILTIFLLGACVNNSRLTRRYHSLEIRENSDTIRKYTEAHAYALEPAIALTQPARTVFDLSPGAQAALIRELGDRIKPTDDLLHAIDYSWDRNDGTPGRLSDFSRFEKRLVFSVREKNPRPADRISRLTLTLTIDSSIQLLSCNRLATTYEQVDLGTIEHHRSLAYEAGAATGYTAGNTVEGVDSAPTATTGHEYDMGVTASFSGQQSTTETVNMDRRIISLNAYIYDNELSLYQEGEEGRDLTGNVIADITLAFTDLVAERVFRWNQSPTPDSTAVLFDEHIVIYPNIHRDITAQLTWEVDYRKVGKGHRSRTESDDHVQLYHGLGTLDNPVLIIRRNDLRPAIWKLVYPGSDFPFRIRGPTDYTSGDLLFDSYEAARQMTRWIAAWKDDIHEGGREWGDYRIMAPADADNPGAQVRIVPHGD